MKIEKMTEAHRAAVLAMMRVFYASDAVSTNGSEEIFARDIDACTQENPYAEGFVFIEEGKTVGYAMLAKSFSTEFGLPCVWIEDLYFLEAYRGRGFGSAFFAHLEKSFPDCIFRLEVEEENEGAVHTYIKNGFDTLPYMEMKKIYMTHKEKKE